MKHYILGILLLAASLAFAQAEPDSEAVPGEQASPEESTEQTQPAEQTAPISRHSSQAPPPDDESCART